MALADDYEHWARHFPAPMARAWRTFLTALAPVDLSAIPHYSKGSGDFRIVARQLIASTDSTDSDLDLKISAADVISRMQGGVAEPSYTFKIKKSGGAYGAGDSDPTAEYVTYTDTDAGNVVSLRVNVSDGTSTAEIEAAVVIGDENGY